MRVLIVEDEVRLAETLRDLLELERYTADICPGVSRSSGPLRIWNTAICGWKRIPFSLAAESGPSGSAGRNLICWSC